MWKDRKITLSEYEFSIIGMLVITLLPTFGVLVMQIIADIQTNTTHNYRIYFVTAVVFLFTLVLSALLCKKFAKEIRIPVWIPIAGAVLVLAGNILLLVKCYLNSPTVYPAMSGQWFPWHSKANWKMFVFMTVISIIGIVIAIWAGKQRKMIEILRYPAYLAASAVAGFSLYCGNFLVSDKMHGNAYYTSIYNALQNAPYDYSNRSIYGHYAIFLKYPIKLLGGDYTAYNIVISAVGALGIFVFALALDLCIKNHFISILGVWAIPVMYWYYPLNHWQMFPHRVLFAGIELYLFALLFHKKGRRVSLIGYVVCSLAMLWNMETGIVCLGVWAVACIVKEVFFEKDIIIWKIFWNSGLKNAAYSILSVIGMVLLFNLYNMPLGEKWHGLRFLLFPHLSTWDMPEKIIVQAAESIESKPKSGFVDAIKSLDSGFASGLSTHFPLQISAWYFVFLMMGIAIILLVVSKQYKRADSNGYVAGFSAVLALGQLVYFVNRPCFDYLAIAFFEAIIILGIWADKKINQESSFSWLQKGYQMLIIGILSVLSILSVWQSGYRIAERKEIGYYNTEELAVVLEEIQALVPKDTMALGQGIQEIYAQLGWDTGCYFVDMSSLNGNNHALATIVVKSSEQKECIISIREKPDENGNKMSPYRYMSFWGFSEEAITIKKQWELGMDSGSAYWDIYYLAIDTNLENRLLERFGAIYYQDKGQYE